METLDGAVGEAGAEGEHEGGVWVGLPRPELGECVCRCRRSYYDRKYSHFKFISFRANFASGKTCVIDWESTTTRPLWACAHVPACLQSSPFVSKLFRKAIAELPSDPSFSIPTPPSTRKSVDPKKLAAEWLYWEANGARLRMAHRCAEWDGWEEGLVDSILGPEEFESEWFKVGTGLYDHDALKAMIADALPTHEEEDGTDADGEEDDVLKESLSSIKGRRKVKGVNGNASGGSSSGRSGAASGSGTSVGRLRAKTDSSLMPGVGGSRLNPLVGSSSTVVNKVAAVAGKLPFIAEEVQKEKMLNTTGDICGGRGGELGRRLEAWLTVTGGTEIPAVAQTWHGDGDEESHAESPRDVGLVREQSAIGVVGR